MNCPKFQKTPFNCGLSSLELESIIAQFKKFSEIKKVILFGSRSMGNFRPTSDIDLAISGKDIDSKITSLWGQLENNTPLPYKFDLLNFDTLSNKKILEHIENFGTIIYSV